ncbi:MAG: hypothetical protein ACFFDF_03745 [Candidatus Odinarchaeota archaeon]
MSNRSSFVSEYIYCQDCANKIADYLKQYKRSKYFDYSIINSIDGNPVIFSGKIVTVGLETLALDSYMCDCITCHNVNFYLIREDNNIDKYIINNKDHNYFL